MTIFFYSKKQLTFMFKLYSHKFNIIYYCMELENQADSLSDALNK